MVDSGRKVGRAVQLDPPDARAVRAQHTCDALAVGVGVVSIDVEAVAHPAVGRQPRAESEHGEELKIRIIISCII